MLSQKSIGRLRRDFFPAWVILDIAQKTQRFALFRAMCYYRKNQAFGGFYKVFGGKHKVLLI
jgi:hypothetical protein